VQVIYGAIGWGRRVDEIPPFMNGSILLMNENRASYPHIQRMQSLGVAMIVFGAGQNDPSIGHAECTPQIEDH
jgi:hypothetical protein